jgi:hypothetical protein
MNLGAVEKIANSVLYEGYLLYPYRRSAVKNRQRFNFGVLYPPQYCDLQSGSDASEMRTECLVEGNGSTTIEAKVRFLQMAQTRGDSHEGIERDVSTPVRTLDSITGQSLRRAFAFEETQKLEGEVEFGASQLGENLYKLTLSVRNIAQLDRAKPEEAGEANRDQMLLRSLVSVHCILQAAGGEFISLLDPPDQFKAAAATCRNAGAWPVLAGEEGQRNLILASPIILYDYPQTAPESPGDLFDGTEIDEILALRILTLTDAEKLEVRSGDDRARRILERTEMLPPEHFQKLHGAFRGLRTPGGTQ